MTLEERDRIVARNVRALLEETGWLETDLAVRCGLCPRTVYRVLVGLHTHTDTQNKIARAFGIGLDEPYYACSILRRYEPATTVEHYRALHAPKPKPRRSIIRRLISLFC